MEGCSSSSSIGEGGVIMAKKLENGAAVLSRLEAHIPHHRRSKSASEKNLDVSRVGALRSINKNQAETHKPSVPTNAYKVHSPLRGYVNHTDEDASSNQRVSLEKDVEQLQLKLQQERSMRMILERAMGRASSTLSPGHRHFANQVKELISEIELLEDEIANREQHVLALYRTMFDQCPSRAPSEYNSTMPSPAHAKHASRKHPSIITSAFCSSKMFPLQPLHDLVSVDDSRKRNSKSRGATKLGSRADIGVDKDGPDQAKVCERMPVAERTPVLQTLKDHLYQCPSKLSEEMVRCMAVVYCWLRSAASGDPAKKRSPILSRSSTNVILPRRGADGDRDWCGKSVTEISWISTDKSQFSRASYAINNYRVLVEQLEKVVLSQMDRDAQTAFWINIYNSLMMHAYLAYGIPHGSLRRLALFYKAAYKISGHIVTAHAIEHSIFCFNSHRVGKWMETLLSTALKKKSGEERKVISSTFGLTNPQPLACFALCTGAFSDPVLKVYTAANIKEELDSAKREFLQAHVTVKKSKKVFLPRVLERYAREASISSDDLLKWVVDNVDKKLRDSVQRCIDGRSNKKASQVIEWLPYSSRFRYVLSKDLTEKPWWV